MKNKITNDDAGKFLKDIADQIMDEFEKEIILTECSMKNAKEDLLATFTDRQKKLYQKYVTAKQKYIDVVFERAKATRK